MVDDESKCPVSGKRKYATEGEALATAAHQISTAHAPKEQKAIKTSGAEAGGPKLDEAGFLRPLVA